MGNGSVEKASLSPIAADAGVARAGAIAEQNAFTRRYLDPIRERPAIARMVGELLRTAPLRRVDLQYRRGSA